MMAGAHSGELGMISTGPITERDRIAELDVLRGIALFGVLTMNFVYFASAGQLASSGAMKCAMAAP